MARAASFELDVTAPPPIDDGLAVRGVFDRAAREVNDDGIGTMGVNALARADLHARTEHRHAIVLEHRPEAHARERRIARFRSGRRRRRWGRTPRLYDDDCAMQARRS